MGTVAGLGLSAVVGKRGLERSMSSGWMGIRGRGDMSVAVGKEMAKTVCRAYG